MGNFCDAFSSVCVRTKSSPKKSLTASDISKSICKIYISDQKITGFLLKLPKQGKNSFYLLTNNHLITDEMLNKKQEIKLYYDDNDSKNVSINLDQNERYIRNFKENNISVNIIEILPKDKIEESYFLLPNLKYINNSHDELKNGKIRVIGNIGYTDCTIEKISGNEFIFKQDDNLNVEKIKQGNPIFLKDSKEVIGITKEESEKGSVNHADFLSSIYNILINEVKDENAEIQKEKQEIKEAKEVKEEIKEVKEEIKEVKEEIKEEKEEIKENKIELEDGGYYIGELNDDEIPNGKGKYFFKNGEIYEGEILDDKFEGNGKYIYENGEYYTGQWKNDLRHGKGTLYYKNNNIKYKGDFVDDQFEGQGEYFWENGEFYKGEFKNGLNNGKGVLYYSNKTVEYEGDFVNDKFEGEGKYMYEDGQYYLGEFKNGLKHGKGKLFYKNGNIEYEGDFLEGKFDGEGKYIYENGDYYEGKFKNGLSHGNGKECDKNGNIISEGEWANDVKV